MKPDETEELVCACAAVGFVLILVYYMILILPNL